MADEKTTTTSPASEGPATASRMARVGAIGRVTVPYLAAAVFAATAMAWYFFVSVPGKRDYFVGLRFRTLAVASAQIKSKAENLDRALAGAVNPLDDNHAPLPAPPRDHVRDYFAALVPEIQLDRPDAPGLHLSNQARPSITATVAWDDVVRAASALSRRDFDDLILADSEGRILWQREQTTPRVSNLKDLLNLESERSGWFSLSWQLQRTTVKEKESPLPGLATLAPVHFGGVSSYLFVQAVGWDTKGIEHKAPLYVAGLVSRRAVERQAMHIPMLWIVILSLPVLLVFLALPFIKLATLTPKERYSFADVALLGMASLCTVAIGAILPFGPAVIDSSVDDTLTGLAKTIDARFAEETARVLDLSDAIRTHEPFLLNVSPSSGAVPDRMCQPYLDQVDENARPEWCGLWQALNALETAEPGRLGKVDIASIELDILAWLTRDGWQARKLSPKSVLTIKTNVGTYDFFKRLKEKRTWSLANPKLNQTPFTVEPLRTPTTAELGVVFAVETKDADRPYLMLNTRPLSVVDPVVPPGYGFAVLSADGKVQFHSEEGLGLAENFLEEVNNHDEVREWAASARTITWNGDYHGRPHRLHIQPVQQLTNSPWRILTFQEHEPVLETQVREHKAILRLAAADFAALIVIAIVSWIWTRLGSRQIRDIMLSPTSASANGVYLLAVLAVVSILLILWSYFPTANRWLNVLYVWFLAVPLLALLVWFLTRRGWLGRQPALERPWRLAEVILLLLVMGVVPVIGFARIACRVEDSRQTERWLELARAHWEARHQRVLNRVRSSGYSPTTIDLIEKGKGFARDWTGPQSGAKEPPYSYLLEIKRLKLLPSSSSAGTARPSHGQRLVRFILDWDPFTGRKTGPPEAWALADGSAYGLSSHAGDKGPVFAATIEQGFLADLLFWRFFFGVAIITCATCALCWARRKLTPPLFLPPQTFDAQMERLDKSCDCEAVLLIGPPRTRKDSEVQGHIRKRVSCDADTSRIRLLDRELNDRAIEKELERINHLLRSGRAPLDKQGRLWLHLSNLESQLITVESRKFVLKLLEKLLDKKGSACPRVVIVTTTVDPIANFQEVFNAERQGTYRDVVPEVELSRSSLLLSRFRRCYLPALCQQASRSRWRHWLHYNPAHWQRTLELEASHYEPLKQIFDEIPTCEWDSAHPSLDALSRAFGARAEAVHQLMWTSCTRSEKLVLIQLAQEGMVNPKCYDVVARLVAKGIVVTQPGLTVFNFTFRKFLRGIERSQVVSQWEQMDGSGLWVTAGRLVGSSLLLGGLFFFLTQDYPVQSLFPIVSGTGLFSLPLIRDLANRLAALRSGTTIGGSSS